MYGPYFAVNNDAEIILDVLEKNADLRELLRPGDNVLLDRGFRDGKSKLKELYQLKVSMPTCNYNKNYFRYIFLKKLNEIK